jgi:UDP-glucuronate decarboxylase
MQMSKKVFAVTGGAGFLGYNLCESLLEDGHRVKIIDNLSTGTIGNVTKLQQKYGKQVSFMEKDIINPFFVECEYIYNLACPASPPSYQLDKVHTMLTNVYGAHHVMELAHVNKAKVMQASTSEVYGDPLVHPQPESYRGNVNINGPRSCYDEGKRAAETLMLDYSNQHNVDLKIVRIFNTYGPMMDPNDGRVVSNFITQALRGEPITIYGDGSQTRSFCYVSDLIRGFRAITESDDPEFKGPINLGNPGEFTMIELAQLILDMTGSKSVVMFEPLPQDDPTQRRPDISLVKSRYGWSPNVELESGLEKTISYFRKRLGL